MLFTLDYEVYGNGEGDLKTQVIAPTKSLMEICNEFDAKINVFADAAEFKTMKGVKEYEKGVAEVELQLEQLISKGHDVQLHIHPQWYDAQYIEGKWRLNYEFVSIARLSYESCLRFLLSGKNYLESVLRKVNSNYKCHTFRAGYWCMNPSRNILRALHDVGIKSDSSVFKWGKEEDVYVSFDYTKAYSNIQPWFADFDDINRPADGADHIFEIPIYSEKANIISMLTFKRLALRRLAKETRNELVPMKRRGLDFYKSLLFSFHSKKFDYCKLTFSEMKRMIDRVVDHEKTGQVLPVCMIGHSKEFIFHEDLRQLMRYITDKYRHRVKFDTYSNVLKELGVN